ncbi:RLA class II histocompatibility antigen, DP alpha-1 chain-like isoform X1 [Nannospalax galili]|uniref:RLA class II histocompatibility antigen, DP alpha-1 chain-like isoform X2 n=1 Tax=Nannospalax galili TaxID=1026970 RepID=UPI0004ED0E5B|nr:RLA class II histocompatibility antigen, DP alpha-1 chain-like isoform X2 [Nannospalax galili]XP_029426240.1 RLA class II histocompatibility antigen, DP alpha-1 chain-like isoform X1 [Nannospalax galili]
MSSTERMFQTKAVVLRALFLALLLSLAGAEAIKADHVAVYDIFAQMQTPSGDCVYEFDGDEQFYVDFDKEETVWGLPEFSGVFAFDAQGALPYIVSLKNNLKALIQRPNITQAPNEPPEVTVFPKSPVELGQPNVLICHIDKFFPPVLNVTWLRNGQPVTEGASETTFLPSTEFRFHKFHYLPFIPTAEDFYDCRVEHWGLDQPSICHWEVQESVQVTEMTETVVCALGLAVGLVGIIVGTMLIIRALCPSHDPQAQRDL